MNRLNPFYLFRGHWRALSNYRLKETRPAYFTRAIVILVPLGAGVWMFVGNGTLADPGSLLAALGLLAGSLLAAFGQLSTWRLRLTESEGDFPTAQRIDRDQMDDTAAQLLVASYGAAVGALSLVLGMNLAADGNGVISGFWAALSVAIGSHVILIFLIALPRLYAAYVTSNNVRKELSGFTSGSAAKGTDKG